MSLLDQPIGIDETSALVRVAAEVRLGALEERLAERALILSPLPVESRGRTVGAALSAPRPSEGSPRGRLLDRCAALEAILADGTAISTRLAPRKATGPDPMAMLLGTRGAAGRIVRAVLRVRRRPQRVASLGFAFADGLAALARARRLIGRGVLPAELLLLDAGCCPPPLASALGWVAAGDGSAPGEAALLLLRLEGARHLVEAEEELVRAELGEVGGHPIGAEAVEAFLSRRAPLGLAEAWVPAARLASTWAGRGAPSILCALGRDGAALLSTPEALPPPPSPDPALSSLRAALFAALAGGTG